MPSINDSNSPVELRQLLETSFAQRNTQEKKEPSKAVLAQLTKTLKETLEQVALSTSSAPTSKSGPSNAEMQQAIGRLMGLLSELQGKLTQYGYSQAESNVAIGGALSQALAAQVKLSNQDLQTVLKDQNAEHGLGIFLKVLESIVGAVGSAFALLGGQPQLAAVLIIFTILGVSGGMNKLTESLGDAIGSSLAKSSGLSKEDAQAIGKVLADIFVITATIVITAVTCGAGAGEVAEEGEEDGAQGANGAKYTAIAGTQAFGATNYGTDLMTMIIKTAGLKSEKSKIALNIMGALMTLVVTLSGGIMIGSVLQAPNQLNNVNLNKITTLLKTLLGVQIAGTLLESGVGLGTGITDLCIAKAINDQNSGSMVLFQGLIKMNDQELSTIYRALTATIQSSNSGLANLSRNVTSAESELSRLLAG